MSDFGKNGRFMQDALNTFDNQQLINFFQDIGVETVCKDGFRVFPSSHNSETIITALESKLKELNIEILCSTKVEDIIVTNQIVTAVKTSDKTYQTTKILLATGGLGYPALGTTGDGHKIVTKLGHSVTSLYPAMMPLTTKETWVKNCTANTIAKVKIKIDIKKYKKIQATGDLIFTTSGIKGPVILDFAREITPLFDTYDEVPLLLNFTNGLNEEQITVHIKEQTSKHTNNTILEHLTTLVPTTLGIELCNLAQINPTDKFNTILGSKKLKLIQLLAWTPLTIINKNSFDKAMITRGGINLKEINPKTMESKLISGLYFGGEIVNLDGPCGGYNLQWSFSSGYLASLN